jgi:hypothetical protein
MTGDGRPQGRGFSYVMAVAAVALLIVAAKTAYDYRTDSVEGAQADARTATYFAAHSVPFCAFEGVWYDWEDDETVTLGCLEVKGSARQGSYSSAMGPRATSNVAISGAYDIDYSSIRVAGKDGRGRSVRFSKQIYADDEDFPTQMAVVDDNGEKGLYIWKRKE